MIKKITSSQLHLGMYIQKLEGSWTELPFLRKSFLLKKDAEIKKINEYKIEHIWIDTSKGIDAEPLHEKSQIENPALSGNVQKKHINKQKTTSSVISEVSKAKKICDDAKEVVASMFQDVRMGNAIDLKNTEPLVKEITASVYRNTHALISIVRLKTQDNYTYMHSVAVSALMIALAKAHGLSEQEVNEAGLGGLMHDVGKALMPIEVLNNPGKLTEAEFTIMKQHPQKGHDLLLEGGNPSEVALDIALHHHEKVDGNGYPSGQSSDKISLMSRMAAVCDVYDAVTSERPYKKAWDPFKSLKQMGSWNGHFDKQVFRLFVNSIGIYPIGSLVRLQSEKLGVVIDANPNSLLTPKVKTFYSTKTKETIPINVVDLSNQKSNDKIIAVEDSDKWHFNNLEQFWLEV